MMSERYLLVCECGRNLPVELGQAGGHIRCSCGREVDVPTLRQLRKLPLAPADYVADAPAWTWQKATMFVGLLLVVAGAVFGAYTRWNRPLKPLDAIALEEKQGAEELRRVLDTARPAEVVRMFNQLKELKLSQYAARLESHPSYSSYADAIKTYDYWTMIGWSLAGVGVAVIAITHIFGSAPSTAKPTLRAAPPRKAKGK